MLCGVKNERQNARQNARMLVIARLVGFVVMSTRKIWV